MAAIVGCSTIEAFTDLTGALRAEGFSDVEATVGGDGSPVVLVVTADAPSGSSTDEALDEATEIVWTTFPRRFDVLQLTVDGEGRRLDYAEIEEDLGARPARLDETDLTDEVTRLSLGLVVGLVAGVLLVALVVGIVLLVATRRRRRRGVIGGPPPTGLTAWAPPVGAPGGPPPAWGPPTGPPAAWAPPPHASPPESTSPPPGPIEGGPPTGPPPPPPAPPAPTPPATPAALPLTAEERADAKREARRIGRRPRGPRPPATQVPPGWG
jgi:hypothetical protein